MFKYAKLLWSACVQATGKLEIFTHSLSTKPADSPLNVFKPTALHTVSQLLASNLLHKLNSRINSVDLVDIHTIHLAYNYNYSYINKGLKGLAK